MTFIAGVLAVAVLAAAMYAIYRRPQRGLLLTAALVPFHGLLLIIPHGQSFVYWKEGLLAATLVAALFTPHRQQRGGVSLPWLPIAIVFGVVGVISAVVTLGVPGALYPIKITFFYMVVVPLICWYAPLTPRDRDNLVTIIMAVSVVTAVWGIAPTVPGSRRIARYGLRIQHRAPYQWCIHAQLQYVHPAICVRAFRDDGGPGRWCSGPAGSTPSA